MARSRASRWRKRFDLDWRQFAVRHRADAARAMAATCCCRSSRQKRRRVSTLASSYLEVTTSSPGATRQAAARAVVEAQALSMRRFSDWIGHKPRQLVLTGGASRNPGIQSVIADVFEAPVRILRVATPRRSGPRCRAARAVGGTSWDELFKTFVALDPSVHVKPNPSTRPAYDQLSQSFDEKLGQRLTRQR